MTNQDMSEKVVIVTGAAGGIGSAAVRALAGRGARVLAVDLDGDAVERSIASLPSGQVRAFTADVRRSADVEAYSRAAVELFGRLDGVVLNAGIYAEYEPVENFSEEAFDRVYEVNQRGVWLGIKHAAPLLRESGGGSIVLTSSIQGLGAVPQTSAYTATKHAVIGLMRGAALELARDGIRVNTVNPGFIETAMLSGLVQDMAPEDPDTAYEAFTGLIPAGRYGRPEEIAAVMAFLISDDSSYCYGNTFVVDGGVMASLVPG